MLLLEPAHGIYTARIEILEERQGLSAITIGKTEFGLGTQHQRPPDRSQVMRSPLQAEVLHVPARQTGLRRGFEEISFGREINAVTRIARITHHTTIGIADRTKLVYVVKIARRAERI